MWAGLRRLRQISSVPFDTVMTATRIFGVGPSHQSPYVFPGFNLL